MEITARDATNDDLGPLGLLYARFADEQTALRPMWHEAEGLPQPPEDALDDLVESGLVTVGQIDDVVVGFMVAEELPLVDIGERIGLIRYLFTEPEARGVGVADEMFSHGVARLMRKGIAAFDATVSPGHREAKNFYEAHGFSARKITMHSRGDDRR